MVLMNSPGAIHHPTCIFGNLQRYLSLPLSFFLMLLKMFFRGESLKWLLETIEFCMLIFINTKVLSRRIYFWEKETKRSLNNYRELRSGYVSEVILHICRLNLLPFWASLVAHRLKRWPAMRETWVRSLGQEDPLETEMATHSSILAWRIPWTRSLVGYSPQGCKESDTTEQLLFHFHFSLSLHLVHYKKHCTIFSSPNW